MKAPEITILGIDSATRGCAAAITRATAVLAEQNQPMDRGQAEALMPMIEDVLKTASLKPADLDAIAVTYGPGGFTGLRIALAAARGMALALNVPCIGVTTFEAVALGALELGGSDLTKALLVVIESKRDDVYAQLFSAHPSATPEALSEPFAANSAKLKDLVDGFCGASELWGDGADRALELLAGVGIKVGITVGATDDVRIALSLAPELPSAAVICRLGAGRFDQDVDFHAPQPLYLRPPDAKLPQAGGRLRP